MKCNKIGHHHPLFYYSMFVFTEVPSDLTIQLCYDTTKRNAVQSNAERYGPAPTSSLCGI